jgi:inorganic pyrophosphatase
MDLRNLTLHPNFPEQVWVVVEQPRGEPYRLQFDPVQGIFKRTEHLALTFTRRFSGVYGWIGGTGLPPAPHFDVLLCTRQSPQPGEVVQGHVCGMFKHQSGDHKFVAVDDEMRHTLSSVTLTALSRSLFEELICLYPLVRNGEGWFCAETAVAYLKNNQPTHD